MTKFPMICTGLYVEFSRSNITCLREKTKDTKDIDDVYHTFHLFTHVFKSLNESYLCYCETTL